MNLAEEIRYNYSDYLEWDDDVRYELIDGVPYLMAAPSQKHQELSGELFRQLSNWLRGKRCKVFHAAFDVRLNAKSYDNIVVQPDLLVVCDRRKLDGRSCVGAPDMIIEILSPTNARHDEFVKFGLYQKAGVREYWIVDPESKTVSVHILENGRYYTDVYLAEDTVPVYVLEGCEINLADVFAEDEDEEEDIDEIEDIAEL